VHLDKFQLKFGLKIWNNISIGGVRTPLLLLRVATLLRKSHY